MTRHLGRADRTGNGSSSLGGQIEQQQEVAVEMEKKTEEMVMLMLNILHFKNCHPLQYVKPKNCSWVWTSICVGIEILKKHSMWEVRNGLNIHAFRGNWIHDMSEPMCRNYPNLDHMVCDFIDTPTRSWNRELVEDFFTTDNCNKILNTRIPFSGSDRLIWPHTKSGTFSVKSCYHIISRRADTSTSLIVNDPIYKTICGLPVIPKVQLFLWECCENIIPSKYRVGRYNANHNLICSMCQANVTETAEHIILHCDFAVSLWNSVPWGTHILQSRNTTITTNTWLKTFWIYSTLSMNQKCTIITTPWYIWRDKYMLVFQNQSLNKDSTASIRIDIVVTDITGTYKGCKIHPAITRDAEEAENLAIWSFNSLADKAAKHCGQNRVSGVWQFDQPYFVTQNSVI
ncbi:uncharacterized protein LOC113352795 [Papaver somniferum]|uniref:uncharacterized protein LOC113352795 n=1 Tax=Papaver somniferum TaxID=3469 RepID=UPI000E6FDAF2|nr:uncharacterized protein LOC113352795 [Papaver somniferum]